MERVGCEHMPIHIMHHLHGGQLLDFNRVNAGPDHNRGVPANGAQQFNWSGFSLMLISAAQMMVLAWQVVHVPWPLLLLALMTWFIGCLRLYGFRIAFPVYYHQHGGNNQGAAAPASAGRDGMVNNAEMEEENAIPDEGSLAWSGYALMVLSVLALWSGFVSEPVAVFLAFVLLLLGCGFLQLAMLAPLIWSKRFGFLDLGLAKSDLLCWHTGLVEYGNEYFFGGGIQSLPAGRTPYGRPVRVVELGETRITREVFEDYLCDISPRYTAETYRLLSHNCNNFSNEVAQFLAGAGIPDYILNLPGETEAVHSE
uniref:PPPDE domain-containing protein n=1 Tax=Oryza punctata TaxID=4537 RepID=A0A0E0LEK9_ORYPU